MTRITLAVGGLLLILSLILASTTVYFERRSSTLTATNKALQGQLQAEQSASAALALRLQLSQRRAKEKVKNDSRLDTALGASPDWSGTPVPADVADAIRLRFTGPQGDAQSDPGARD